MRVPRIRQRTEGAAAKRVRDGAERLRAEEQSEWPSVERSETGRTGSRASRRWPVCEGARGAPNRSHVDKAGKHADRRRRKSEIGGQTPRKPMFSGLWRGLSPKFASVSPNQYLGIAGPIPRYLRTNTSVSPKADLPRYWTESMCVWAGQHGRINGATRAYRRRNKGVSTGQHGRIDGATRAYRRVNMGVSTGQQGRINGGADTPLLKRPAALPLTLQRHYLGRVGPVRRVGQRTADGGQRTAGSGQARQQRENELRSRASDRVSSGVRRYGPVRGPRGDGPSARDEPTAPNRSHVDKARHARQDRTKMRPLKRPWQAADKAQPQMP